MNSPPRKSIKISGSRKVNFRKNSRKEEISITNVVLFEDEVTKKRVEEWRANKNSFFVEKKGGKSTKRYLECI